MNQASPIHDLERTIAGVERLMVGVRPKQWSNPTPCPEWDVRQLVNHMAAGNLRFAALVSGRSVTPDASDDPAKIFHLAGVALRDSLAQPGALERSYPSPFGELPGPALIHLRIGEMLTHGWDLARATGQPPELPEDLAEQELALFRAQLGTAPRDGSPVGQPQTCCRAGRSDRPPGGLPGPAGAARRGGAGVKYVLFVNFDQPGELLLPHVPDELRQHLRCMRAFHRQGSLLMSGAFRTPGQPLATMGVFRSCEAAQTFAGHDPFVLNGLATSWRVLSWEEPLPEPDWASTAAVAPVKYVLSFTTRYTCLDEAYADAPEEIGLHMVRMQTFQREGRLLMAGGFADADGPLTTMAILPTREATEAFAAGDPFVLNGKVTRWDIQAWNDVLAHTPLLA